MPPKTVLVVDSDPLLVRRIAAELIACGAVVEFACVEDEAISLLRSMRPSAVVCSSRLNVFTEARRVTGGQVRMVALTERGGKVKFNRRVDASFNIHTGDCREIAAAALAG